MKKFEIGQKFEAKKLSNNEVVGSVEIKGIRYFEKPVVLAENWAHLMYHKIGYVTYEINTNVAEAKVKKAVIYNTPEGGEWFYIHKRNYYTVNAE